MNIIKAEIQHLILLNKFVAYYTVSLALQTSPNSCIYKISESRKLLAAQSNFNIDNNI